MGPDGFARPLSNLLDDTQAARGHSMRTWDSLSVLLRGRAVPMFVLTPVDDR